MCDHGIEIKFYISKNFFIRQKSDDRAVELGITKFLDCAFFLSLRIFLRVFASVSVYFCFTINRECIHHRRTHTVEPSRDFVSTRLPAKLSSRMKCGHDHLESRDFCFTVNIYWYSSAVVCDSYFISWKENYLNI